MNKQCIIYLLVFVLYLEGTLMKCEPMKVEAATTYKYTMSYITGGGDLTSKFKITIGGKKLTGLCRHGGAKSAHSGKATAKLLSRTDKRFYLAYYYGYVKKWTSGSKGCDLARAFNYATYGNAYHQSASRSKEMINTAKEYCKKNGVPDNFVAYNCDPTNGSQEFIAWYYGANGTVRLVKKSSDTNAIKTGSYTFKDIKYRVYESKSTSGTVVGTLTLNASGISNTLKLAPDGMNAKKYYIREYSTNDCYELSSTWYTAEIKPGGEVTITAKDMPKYGTLSFTKALTSNSAADSTVQGFTFTLTNTNNSSLKYRATSDANGKVSFTKIPIGKYTLTENLSASQASQNYVTVTGNKTVTIKAGSNTLGTSENTYVNERIIDKPRLLIQKITDDGGSVADWEFTVTNTETGQTFNLKTDNTGQAVLEDINAGVIYAVSENMTAEQKIRYMQPISQSKKLEEGSEENLVFHFENKAIHQAVSIKKTAEDGNVHGIEFTLSGTKYAGTSDAIEMIPIVSTTDEDGNLNFGELVPGEYVIEETGFDSDYYINNHKLDGYDNPAVAFSVTTDGVYMDGKVVSDGQFEFINSVYSIELVKTEVLVNGTKTDRPVKDAGYTLYYVESDGTETMIDSYVTDESGKFTVKGVRKGSYRLYETAVPMGYVEKVNVKNEGTEEETQSPIPIDFTVGNSAKEQITVVKDTNQQKYGTIFVVKEDKDRYPVEDAEFTLFTDEECKNVAKDKDGNVLVAKTDEKGYIIFDNLSWTTYYLKETQAPRGYVQSEEVHKFVIGYDAEEDLIVVDQEIWLTNEHKLGSVELLKVDEDEKIISASATYDLYKTDGTLVAESLVTGKGNNGTGLLRVDNLEWGSYYFLEKIAPDGYGLSSEKIRFTVNALSSSTVQRVKAIDKEEITYIIATKKIKADDINFDNGTPSFFFRLEGITTAGNKKIYNRSVTFSEEFVNKHTDSNGYVSLSVTFDNLPTGKYVLSEEIVSRFTLDKIEESSLVHGTINQKGDTVVFDLSSADMYGAATFVNKNFEPADYSDSVMLSNVVSKQRTYTALSAEYNGEVLAGNQPIDNFNDYLTVYAIYDDGTERILESDEYTAYDIDGMEFVRAPKVAGFYTLSVHHEEDEITHSDTVEVQVETAKKVTVKFQSNGGNTLEDMSVYQYDTLAKSTIDASKYTPTRTGYTFAGWYSDRALTQKVDAEKTPILVDTILHAKWEINNYTIIYDLKGGTLDNSIDTYTIETDTFSIPTPVKDGYSFDGWTGSNGDEPQTEVIIPKGSTGTREYVANWSANKLVTTYNVNGGRISYATSGTYGTDSTGLINYVSSGKTWTHIWTYNQNYTISNHTAFGIEKPGYVFQGWCTDPNGNGTVYASLSTAAPSQLSASVLTKRQSTVVLYAIWKEASNVLITGRKFNATIKSGVKKTVFTTSQAPYETTVDDLSVAGDKGIVGWVQNGTYYISSQRSGVKVKANSSSDFMFSGNPNNSTFAGNALWQKVTSHDLTNLDTSSVTSFNCFFNYNKALTTITGLNNLNTANVTNMNALFYYCSSLTSLTLNNWNTSKVTVMQSVFNGCTSLTSVNVSGWDVDQVTNFSHTFCWTPKLATIDLSTWKTTSATNMRYMFAVYASSGTDAEDYTGRSALATLKLGAGWTTANVTNVRNMFFGCSKLILNCKGWNVKKVTNHSQFNLHASQVTAPTWP